jgi:hypothetical protein
MPRREANVDVARSNAVLMPWLGREDAYRDTRLLPVFRVHSAHYLSGATKAHLFEQELPNSWRPYQNSFRATAQRTG